MTETPPVAASSPAVPDPTVSAPQFLTRPSSVTADQAKSARFSCSVSGFPLPVVTWAKDEKILQDEGRFEIYDEGQEFIMEVFELEPEDEGLYTVTAENPAGKAATGAQLTINSRFNSLMFPNFRFSCHVSGIHVHTVTQSTL